jgi:hypothetical protein
MKTWRSRATGRRPPRPARAAHQVAGGGTEPRNRRRRDGTGRSRPRPHRAARAGRRPVLPLDASQPAPTARPCRGGARRIRARARARAHRAGSAASCGASPQRSAPSGHRFPAEGVCPPPTFSFVVRAR